MIFKISGLIKNEYDKAEIEFWGHDAGEFTLEEIEDLLEIAECQEANLEDK